VNATLIESMRAAGGGSFSFAAGLVLLAGLLVWLVLEALRAQLAETRFRCREAEQAQAGWNGLRKFAVAKKVAECDDVGAFYLKPHDGRALPVFKPGQYLTFQLDLPGRDKPLVRCYSLSDCPQQKNYYRVTIKKEKAPPDRPDLPPGAASSYFCDTVKEGDILNVKTPPGHCFLAMSGTNPIVLIGGGVGTTKNCEDCHISKANDNNARLAQLLGFGTGTVNFFGRYACVGEGKSGLDAVVWTEHSEPQAAHGSQLQRLAYPDDYKKHFEGNHGKLKEAYHQDADNILDLQLRGEYLYTANGAGGFRVFDVADVDNKGFSERITTAPVSPLGQRTCIPAKFATSVTLPGTLGIDPLRTHRPENEDQPVSPIYAWVFVNDREEGLVMMTVRTLVDGDPDNDFLDHEKVIRFNPDGNLFVADSFNQAVREMATNGMVSTVSGLARVFGSTDGLNGQGRFFNPYGLAFGADGSLMVSDACNELIRLVIVPFRVTMQSSNGTSRVTLFWDGVIGKKYQVQYKDTINAAVWSNLGAPIMATSPTATQTDTVAGAMSQRLYRVIIVE
jgi:Oxidoreductase FAD-binding domain